MKKLIIAAGLLLSIQLIQAQPPQGQQPPGIEERIKRTNEVLQQEVQPNADQKKVIEAAFKKFFTATDKLMGNNPPNSENLKVQKQIEALEKERDESIKKVLTKAQFKKYEAAAKKMKPPKPGEKRGEGPPPPKNK